MSRGRDVARSNARTAMPETRSHGLTLGRGVRHRIWGTLNGHQQPIPGSLTSGRAASKPIPGSLTSGRAASKPTMRERPTHGNAQVKSFTARPPKQANPQGRARGNRARRRRAKTHSFVGKRDTHRVHARSDDNRMCNPLSYRADRPTKGWHKDTPRTGWKNRSQVPNCSNSFIRDQIVRSRPERGTPSWRNTDQLSKVDFVTIESEKNTHDPQGDPIAKQRRIDERKKPSFRSSVQKSTTQPETGDPIAKAWRQPLGKVRKEFVPIEIWDKLDPTGWPHREDSNQTPGRWRKRLRSDRGLRQTRPGRVTPSRRLDSKTEAEIPKEHRFWTLEVGQIGEAGEYTPEPTNWRGRTTNRHSQSWDSTDETSRGLSMDARPAVMARP